MLGLQVVAEAFRLLLLAINRASSNGNHEAEQSLLAVLLLLLIKDVAPNLTAAPALCDIATKLVTHIASGPASAAFKAVVTGLPTQDKAKLQVAGTGLSCTLLTVSIQRCCRGYRHTSTASVS